MATGWVKSLQCKSKALDDVVHGKSHRMAAIKNHLHTNSSCRQSVQSLKDVVDTTKPKPRKTNPPQTTAAKKPNSRKSEPGPGSEDLNGRPRVITSTRLPRATEPIIPALSELPEGHPSRNVVEIIFHTSWSSKAFSARIEMVFKVQNLPRTVARFEDYREMVKSHAGSGRCAAVNGGCEDQARCVADGNEMMRFYCLGPTNGGAYETGGGAWNIHGGKGAAICTFSGSGAAHESAGGGRGRRAMLVCRVIAGRVCKQLTFDSLNERVGLDSVSGEGGELLVFDSRALLPCFLIIYKL